MVANWTCYPVRCQSKVRSCLRRVQFIIIKAAGILDSVFWGKNYIFEGGVNLMYLFILCVFWVFFSRNLGLGGGGGNSPPEEDS